MPLQLRSDLTALTGYHSPQVAADVRLNTNESPYPPPPGFFEALQRALHEMPLHRYPDRHTVRLREAIAHHEGVPPASVFPANGSNEIIQTLLLAFGGPGRTACVFTPSYTMHTHIAQTVLTPVVEVKRRADFLVGGDLVAATVAELAPSIMFFCHPNNPTGLAEDEPAVRAALDFDDMLVVVDEAYREFLGTSWAQEAVRRENLAVCRTFSKAWGIPALRLGYLLGSPAWIGLLDQVHLPYHLNAFSQVAGMLSFDFVDEMRARVATLTSERDRLYDALAARSDLTVWPSLSNFLLFRPVCDAETLWRGLLEHGILVRNFASRPGIENCLRVTVGTPAENSRFLSALAAVLSAVKPATAKPGFGVSSPDSLGSSAVCDEQL